MAADPIAGGGGYPGHWSGRFVWYGDERYPFHRFLMARRGFRLPAAPRRARLAITAEDRYVLYVNGTYLGRGPARSDPRWKSYDTYDVSAVLQPGRNAIAVLAYHYGCQNNYSRDARAGLFVQLDAEAGDGTRTTIGTDGQWRVRPAQGWRRDVGLVSVTVGVTEVYDARADPPDWYATGFDDDAWEPAQVIAEQMASWAYLEPRQTPMLQEVDEHPARVVEQGEIIELSRMAADVQVPERLAVEPHLPLQHARIDRPGNALAAGGEPALLQRCSYRPGDDPRQGVRSPYLIFDFGRQVFGFPRLHLDGPAGAVVEMTYGPVLVAGRIMPMANQLRYGDRYLMRAGAQVWQTFEYKQFRYLQVVVRGTDQPVRLHAAGVRAYRYPAERTGSFACSDPVLNALWQASIDTVDLHMEDGLVCDAARERRFWPGAGALGLYAVWAAYGDVALTDWHLRLTARGQLGDGLLRAWYPGTEGRYRGEQTADPLTATVFDDPKNYPTETLYFTIIAGDHQRYLGGSDAKRRLAAELYPRLIRAAGWFERQRDADGVLYQLPKEIFIDWMPHDMRGASFTLNVLYARFLAVLGDLAESLEEPDEAASWRAQAGRLREHLRASHWDDRRGLFVDSVFAGERSRTVSELSNGMALVFGVADERQTARIVAHLEQPPEDLLRTTPLILFFVLEGLAAAGRTDLAVRIMRERYAPMMAATDAPTMWESWSMFVRERGAMARAESRFTTEPQFASPNPYSGELTGLVHSSSVAPAWTLSRHVLGILPAGAGFARCRIAPPAVPDLRWARGVLPAARGPIGVRWQRRDAALTLQVDLPDGLDTEVVLPRDAGSDLRLTRDGSSTAIPADAATAEGVELSATSVTLRLTGGVHRIELSPAP